MKLFPTVYVKVETWKEKLRKERNDFIKLFILYRAAKLVSIKLEPKLEGEITLKLGEINTHLVIDSLFGNNIKPLCVICHDKKSHPSPFKADEFVLS